MSYYCDRDRLSKNDFLVQVSISDSDVLGSLRQVQSGETDEDAVLTSNLKLNACTERLHLNACLNVCFRVLG